jgi:N-acetyl-gamma-glutamyl-phosphate reductase
MISTDNIVVDSKSGVSGAGRDVVLESLFCEVNEGVKAYKIFEHRHLPEIEQELSQLAKKRQLSIQNENESENECQCT